jgi:hypothetical protein
MLDADLNVSIPPRAEFMELMFGITSLAPIPEAHEEAAEVAPQPEAQPAVQVIPITGPTYAGCTNQDMINFFFRAANNLSGHGQYWEDWIVPAGLSFLATPNTPEQRNKFYTGPRIENLPHLTDDQKRAVLDVM